MKKYTFLVLIIYFSKIIYSQNPPQSIINGIDQIFQNHVTQTSGLVPGHILRIEKKGEWVYEKTSGLASLFPALNVSPEMKFKIASITKLFTSVAIFKLIQNGNIEFNAPISKYIQNSTIQGFEDYDKITIKQLLSHTSGINEPQSEYQGRLNYWIYMKRFEDIPIDSLLFWSSSYPKGIGNYYYSNANFYILAEIIKSVTGIDHKDYITKNIISPLGLTNTSYNLKQNDKFMNGYLKGNFYPIGAVLNGGLVSDSLYDFTNASNSWGYGAADLWSNTLDLIKFQKALFNLELINSTWLDSMKTITTNSSDMGAYGYGMMQFKSFNNGPFYGYGHTGSAFGYGSMLNYIPDLNIYICSAGNYMKIGQEFLQRDIYNFLANSKSMINENKYENNIEIFPNPVASEFEIKSLRNKISYQIINLQGQIIKENNSCISFEKQNISDIQKGIYYIKITTDRERVTYKKIIKE